MTEDEAKAATRAIVGDAAMLALERFADQVRDEAARQNLVARPTIDALWLRHILDSAQLLPLATAYQAPANPHASLHWIDVGTGAGFPGMIVALATERLVTLVEPRRMRADFLQRAIEAAGVAHRVTVQQSKVERVTAPPAGIISARAVALLDTLFDSTAQLADAHTLYLLPKGQSATSELDAARRRFAGLFHVEQSITDPTSGIITATNVRRK